MEMLQKLGWDKDLTDEERKAIDAVAGPKTNWKTDLSGGIQRVAIKHGCAPFGNAKARCVVWTFPDPVPLHREPIYTPRRDLLDKYATYDDRPTYRLPVLFPTIHHPDLPADFPLLLPSPPLLDHPAAAPPPRPNPPPPPPPA